MREHIEQATAAPGEVRPTRSYNEVADEAKRRIHIARDLLHACGGDLDEATRVLREVAA